MNRVLAIAGGSGSGKSTLAATLVAALGPERIAVLPIDAYYHDLSHLDADVREAVNFDHPDALDLASFADHVASLKNGERVACPCYDFTTHCRLAETTTIEPRPTLLVEGILVAATTVLRALYDHLVYVETVASVRWRGVCTETRLSEAVTQTRLSDFGREQSRRSLSGGREPLLQLIVR